MAVAKNLLIAFGLYLIASGGVAQNEPAPAAPATDAFTIATGEKVDIPEKGFSLQPPKGWEIHHNAEGLRLLLRAPVQAGVFYQRNIQVLSLAGPYYIDAESQKEFGKILVENFSKVARVEKFSLRDSKILDLSDHSKSILYYTDYEMNGQQLMQANILVSSAKHHFVVTFSDLRDHFEKKEFESLIQEAWTSLMSIHLDSPAPERMDLATWFVAALALLLISTIGTLIIRKRRRNRYTMHTSDTLDTDLDLAHSEEATQRRDLSELGDFHDDEDKWKT